MRLYNFKNEKNSNINYYFNSKKQVIKTNILANKMVEYTANDSLYSPLAKVQEFIASKIKYLDLNGGIFKSNNDLKACYDYLITLNKNIKMFTNVEVLNSRKIASSSLVTPITSVKNTSQVIPVITSSQVQEPEQHTSNEKTATAEIESKQKVNKIDKEKCLKVVNDLTNFFEEFGTDAPKSNRFINNLMIKAKNSVDDAISYVKGYFTTMDFPKAQEIGFKLSSYEFQDILNEIAAIESDKQINKRLYIYYGPAGTGKTTKAIKDYPEATIINCNSDMMAQDLFETFEFKEGKPEFKKSEFVKAMEEGKAIILDEINLLRLDALRALQTITDNKQVFNFKGRDIYIKEGFKIIGTMNLIVNGRVFSLPEPLIDRCADIKEFTISNEDLIERAF